MHVSGGLLTEKDAQIHLTNICDWAKSLGGFFSPDGGTGSGGNFRQMAKLLRWRGPRASNATYCVLVSCRYNELVSSQEGVHGGKV